MWEARLKKAHHTKMPNPHAMPPSTPIIAIISVGKIIGNISHLS